MGHDPSEDTKTQITLSSKDFFKDMVIEAMKQRKISTFPMAADYLVNLLNSYMNSSNLFEISSETGKRKIETLAEMYFKAENSDPSTKTEVYKRLADTSLYIGGFFGDSLKRKVVDIDYYAEMGGTAYGRLAEFTQEDILARVYTEYSKRFLDFVEVLTYISQKSFVQDSEDLLRLYEKYIITGSTLAKDQLLEKGVVITTATKNSKIKQ